MDITGGQLTQTNGNPSFPGAVSTGPLIAGNVVHSDGTGSLAVVGGQSGTANQGFAVMCQFSTSITQAGSTSALSTQVVIPAQSMIVNMHMYVTTAWTGGSTTFTVNDTGGTNVYVPSGAGSSIGATVLSPGTTKANVQLWENVGNADVQLTVTSGGTGSGIGVLVVRYVQGCNSAQSS